MRARAPLLSGISRRLVPTSMKPILSRLDTPGDPTAEVRKVLDGCPVLRAVVDRVRRTGHVDHNALVALRHSLGHLDGGPPFVNELVRRLPGVRPADLLRSRLRDNPMSCRKLLGRVTHEERWACQDCVFAADEAAYPSPVLHAGRAAGQRALGGSSAG